MKKELFRGVVTCLHKGGMNPSQMSDDLEQPVSFVTREIKRITQMPGFDIWIKYNDKTCAYEFVSYIKRCPINSVISMIRSLYVQNGDKIDLHMDLQKKGSKVDMNEDSYDLMDKYIGGLNG